MFDWKTDYSIRNLVIYWFWLLTVHQVKVGYLKVGSQQQTTMVV